MRKSCEVCKGDFVPKTCEKTCSSCRSKGIVSLSCLRPAFEQAIKNEPDNAANHLVYSDWLEERGRDREAMIHRVHGLAMPGAAGRTR